MVFEITPESFVLTDRLFSEQDFIERKKLLETRVSSLMEIYPEARLTSQQQEMAYGQANKDFPVGSLVEVYTLPAWCYGGVVQEIDERGIIYAATVWFPVDSSSSTIEKYSAYKDHAFEPSTHTDRVTTYIYSSKNILPLHLDEARKYGHPRTNEVNSGMDIFQPAKHPFKDLTDGVPYLPVVKDGVVRWSSLRQGYWHSGNPKKIKVDPEGYFTESWRS